MKRMTNVKSFFVALSVLCLTGTAVAQTVMPQEGPTLNRKVRNLGMGNVGTSIHGSHDSSPFYNPAGLNDLKKGRFQFMALTFEAAQNSLGIIGDFDDMLKDIDNASNDADKTRAFNKFLDKNTGKYQHMRMGIDLFNYVRKNFGVGLLLDQRMDFSFRDQSFPHFEVRNLGDVAAFVSGSTDFFDKVIQVGATVRPTVRFSLDEADQQMTMADVLGKDSNGDSLIVGQVKNIYKKQRFGLGVDIGLKSNLAIAGFQETKVYKALQPEIGLTWQDIGSPAFDSAPRNEQSISTGIAVHPKLWKLKNTIAVEFREINQERPLLTKLHVGLETKLPWILSVRAGLSQGYPTGGLSADFWIVKLDAAIYFEEVGIRVREKGNLRWATTLSFNI